MVNVKLELRNEKESREDAKHKMKARQMKIKKLFTNLPIIWLKNRQKSIPKKIKIIKLSYGFSYKP